MKKIDRSQVLSAAHRKNLSSPAKAAEVLYSAEKWLREQVGEEFFWQPKSWKNGSLRIAVHDSATALRIYAVSEELLAHLRKQFDEYQFREVRTEIVT